MAEFFLWHSAGGGEYVMRFGAHSYIQYSHHDLHIFFSIFLQNT